MGLRAIWDLGYALVSARFKMQNKPYFLFRIFKCFVLINKSFDWLINIISYDQKSFDLNQGQKKIKTIFEKLQNRTEGYLSQLALKPMRLLIPN